jgi:hypothetical protein
MMMALSMVTFSIIITLSVITLNIKGLFVTLGMMTLRITLSIYDTKHNDTQHCRIDCSYAGCRVFY